MNKKGFSGVIITLLLTALTISLIAIIGLGIKNLVDKEREQNKKCFGNLENFGGLGVEINSEIYLL